MMSLATERRRADQFATAADGHAHVKLDAETQDFLALVGRLRATTGPRPDPQFADELRFSLMTAASTELVAAPVERSSSARARGRRVPGLRVLPVAASVCIITASGMGVAAASQAALPGDALYPIKRGIENITVSIAGSPFDRGHAYVNEATTRLDEAQALAITRADDPRSATLIASTLTTFVGEAHSAALQLLTAYRQDSGRQSIADLRTFTIDSAEQLQSLSTSVQSMPTSVPPAVADQLTRAGQVVTRIDRMARVTCSACSTLAPLTVGQVMEWLQDSLGISGSPPSPGHKPHGPGPTPHTGHQGKHQHGTPQRVPTSGITSVSPTQVQTPTASGVTTTGSPSVTDQTTAPTTPSASTSTPSVSASVTSGTPTASPEATTASSDDPSSSDPVTTVPVSGVSVSTPLPTVP